MKEKSSKLLGLIIEKISRWREPNRAEIFSTIYKKKIWGFSKTNNPYYSGLGSDDRFAEPYVAKVVEFIQENNIDTVVDLGCGDFRVGKKITDSVAVKYLGVDVVSGIVKYNNKIFSNSNTSFLQLDIVKDKLPKGNLYLIRQVLQHLCNKDIEKIIQKLSGCDMIITEHQPISNDIKFNLDQLTGPRVRVEINSGVFLEKPPFNKTVKKILDVSLNDNRTQLSTYLVK